MRLLQFLHETEVKPKVRVKDLGNGNFKAYIGRNYVGYVSVYDFQDREGKIAPDERYIWKAAVKPEFQRKGVATALYNAAEEYLAGKGLKLVPSPSQQLSDPAYEFWKNRRPESMANDPRTTSVPFQKHVGTELTIDGRPAVITKAISDRTFKARFTDVPEGSTNSVVVQRWEKIRDQLTEAPIPDDWEKSTFSPQTSFKKQLDYAMARAAKLGTGSGRVAFTIQYQGRPTVLKIAKNAKGLAQNEYEAQTLEEYLIKDTGLFIPLIDYDEENEPPRWIHTEMAQKMKPTQFKKFFGVDHNTLARILQYASGQQTWGSTEGFDELIENNELLYDLTNIVANYGMPTGDFGRLANWGVFQGRPVVIDLGLSQGVYDQYYKPKVRQPSYW